MNKNLNIAALFIFIFLVLNGTVTIAQIENVIVEKYYIADSLDATDTVNGIAIQPGSVTYRIFIDLLPGSRLKSIYGDQHHPIVISSTQPVYNNTLQPGADFGYQLNRNLFLSVPTLSLDSWITIGYAAKNQTGVLKHLDADGNFFAGSNNSGGSSMIPGGILNNNDTAAGTPLTVSDGMMSNSTIQGTWLNSGFRDGSGADTTMFGGLNSGTEFISNNSFLQQVNGVTGIGPDTTIILVAQITTAGEISFKLNLELEQTNGSTVTYVKYVSGSDTLLADEVVSPLLSWPPQCGCMDPDYFEYDAVYACSDKDSCKTKIKFGCSDIDACNYDPEVNFNLPELCCYPGFCQDRDLGVVCPELSSRRNNTIAGIYPNPASTELNLSIYPDNGTFLQYSVSDIYGKKIFTNVTGSVSGSYYTEQIDISALLPGIYFLNVITGEELHSVKFIVER